jgi:inner membrane protein
MITRLRRLHDNIFLPLRSPAASVVVVLAIAALALWFDALDETRPFDVVVSGALDEPAHLALTALLLMALAPFRSLRPTFVVPALVASVAIDLDHVPLYLGVTGISAHPGGRPYTHGLITLLAAIAVAWLVPRWRVAASGVAVGLASHLARDVCEGQPGVSLLWPASSHEFLGTQTEFRALVAVLTVVAVGGAVRRRHPTISGDASVGSGDTPEQRAGSWTARRSRC